MPRSLEPNNRLVIVLKCDVDKPKETQPRIFARELALNAQRRLMAIMTSFSATDKSKPDEMIDAALDAMAICLTGWENMTDPVTGESIEFSREAVGDVLALDEMVEVMEFVATRGRLTADERKKSE